MNFAQKMNRKDIQSFLENHFTTNSEDKCKICKGCVKQMKNVAHIRLLIHLRNCKHITKPIQIEANAFAEAINAENKQPTRTPSSYRTDEHHESQHLVQSNTPKKQRICSPPSKKDMDILIANTFYQTGISFRIADTPVWREMFNALNISPPCSKSIRTSYLESRYAQLRSEIRILVQQQSSLTIVTDGWENQRGDHIVNYILCSNSLKPIFWTSVHTGDISQTSENIFNGINQIMLDIGAPRIAAIVTDNAPNMRGAWDLAHDRYKFLICNGCAAHVVNLILKRIFAEGGYLGVLNQAKRVIKAITSHQRVLAMFRNIRTQLRSNNTISQELELQLPTETRWYSQINSIRRVRSNRAVLERLSTEGYFKGDLDDINIIIKDNSFWKHTGTIVNNLSKLQEMGQVFESDDSDLSNIYIQFHHFLKSTPPPPAWIKGIVLEYWDFLKTRSMLIAAFLNPTIDHTEIMEDEDYQIAFASIGKVNIEERTRYTMYIHDLTPEAKNDIRKLGIRNWWLSIGLRKYKMIASLANRIFSIPCSNASSERCWSIIDFIYSKRRNRMSQETINMLTFLYYNSSNPEIILDEPYDENEEEQEQEQEQGDGSNLII